MNKKNLLRKYNEELKERVKKSRITKFILLNHESDLDDVVTTTI